MKTDIKVTYEREDLESMCMDAYAKVFGEAPEGFHIEAMLTSFSSSVDVSVVPNVETAPEPLLDVPAPPVEECF